MSLYVLDTDHLSLYRYGHPEVSARIEATPADQLAVTIITIEEQLRAWYTQVRRARDRNRLARAYQGLFEVAGDLEIHPDAAIHIWRHRAVP
jgi:tRNA(fMet)-specific endonuclease VapC